MEENTTPQQASETPAEITGTMPTTAEDSDTPVVEEEKEETPNE